MPPPGPVRTPPDHLLGSLLQRCADGDETSFGLLYRRSATRAHAVALRLLANHAHAEEVVQEAYVDIWRCSAHFDPERGSALTWMLTIVRRKAVDRVRATVAQERRDAEHEQRNHEIAHDSTLEAAVASLQRLGDGARLHHALGRLLPDQRRALELVYVAGCTQQEVATLIGVPLGTAKSRIRKGLAMLRAELVDAEPSPLTA